MRRSLEKQLKNSKHEDGKLENFICFESKVKSSHSTQLSSGEDFVDVGGYNGGYVGGVRSEWGVATLGEIPVADRKRKLLCCAYRSRVHEPPPWSCVWAFNSRWGLANKVPKPHPTLTPLTPLSLWVNVLMTFTDYEIQMRNGNVCVLRCLSTLVEGIFGYQGLGEEIIFTINIYSRYIFDPIDLFAAFN